MITPEDRERLRKAILRVLDENPSGKMFGIPAIAFGCQRYGFCPSTDEMRTELHYLLDKGLVKVRDKKVSPEVFTWQITAEGMDFVAAES